MLPKKDNKLPPGRGGSNHHLNLNGAIAAALREELGSTHQAIKTVMHWTGASESAVKTWLAGSHGPSGEHLVALGRSSEDFPAVGGQKQTTSRHQASRTEELSDRYHRVH